MKHKYPGTTGCYLNGGAIASVQLWMNLDADYVRQKGDWSRVVLRIDFSTESC